MPEFQKDLERARAMCVLSGVPTLTIEVLPSGQESFPDVYVSVNGRCIWIPGAAEEPDVQLDRIRAAFDTFETILTGDEGGPLVISSYFDSLVDD
jgi:hypothetical protein